MTRAEIAAELTAMLDQGVMPSAEDYARLWALWKAAGPNLPPDVEPPPYDTPDGLPWPYGLPAHLPHPSRDEHAYDPRNIEEPSGLRFSGVNL